MSEPNGILATLTGRGLVGADGLDDVRVRYRVVVERRDDVLRATGTLIGVASELRPVWLMPDALLRLRDGREIAVSVTDLDGDTAVFESTGPVPPLDRLP